MKKIIFLLVAVFLLHHLYQRAPVTVSDIKHDIVILYVTSGCGYCKNMRQFLKDNHINYTQYDIEQSEQGRKQHAALNAPCDVE